MREGDRGEGVMTSYAAAAADWIGWRVGRILVDMGQMEARRSAEVVTVPIGGGVAGSTTYVLHKRQRSPLPEVLQLFLTHATSFK